MTQTTDTEAGSLGMGIMEAFATQLGGSLEVARSGGTSLTVEFKTREMGHKVLPRHGSYAAAHSA